MGLEIVILSRGYTESLCSLVSRSEDDENDTVLVQKRTEF